MATTNGALTPPDGLEATQQPTVAYGVDNKRKREEEDAQTHPFEDRAISRSAQTQRDILEILEQHATETSFLKETIEDKGTSERAPKKARLSDPTSNTPTISSKLSDGAYTTLQDLRKDAQDVSESMVAAVRAKAKDREGHNAGRMMVEDLKQIQRAQAFEQVVRDVVDQESKYEAAHGGTEVKPKQEPDTVMNGQLSDTKPGPAGRNGTVLTLFGNAPTPKQLFSSMQNPQGVKSDPAIKTELPIEEISLPNGLAATKIMPSPADESKKGPTFDDVFPPAYNLPTLHPPKSHRRSSTKDSTITWEFKDPMAKRNQKGGYTVQSLSVGDWLGYGGVDSKEESSSPRERRKQRDRVLSSGESSQPPPSRSSLEDTLAKEEEALFRRAYSSFAPSCDNSKSLVPEETKSMVWWNKVGNKRYNETFAIDPALLDDRPASFAQMLPSAKDSKATDEDFARVVEELNEIDEDMINAESAHDKTDVEQVLHEISQLLETLASYQRIRNATLASSTSVSRTPLSPAPTLASRIGRPDSPSEDEMSTYHSLRRELAYLILKLPPYAVAKLNGNQLAGLGVSQLITFDGKDRKGTMEEDQVARLAKYTAMATAAGIASLSRTGSTGSQHYSSPNQRAPAIGQAANTRYGQSAQYGAARTPASQPQFQRSTSSQPTYGTPSATAPRPGYGQPNQYSRPAAPQSGYGQPNGQQYYQPQRPAGPTGWGSYGQQYNQSTPQSQQRPTYPSQSGLSYENRSQSAAQNAISYQTNSRMSSQQQIQSPLNRTASPIKPANYHQPLQPNPSPRPQQPAYAPPTQQPSSGRATPTGYPSQPQTPVNGYPPQQRPVAPRAASGTPQPPPPQQQTQPVQTNGHARGSSSTPIPSSAGQRERTCDICYKTFDRHSSYVVHMRTHTGERPYVCSVDGCGKDFAVRSNLNRHFRTAHSGASAGDDMLMEYDEDDEMMEV